MGAVSCLGHFASGTVKMATAAVFAGVALHNSQQDFCLMGGYSRHFQGSPIKFEKKLLPCGIANGASQAVNEFAGAFSYFTGQKPGSTFSIPVSTIATVLSGASAIVLAISAIKDFGKAFFPNPKPSSPQIIYVEVPQQNVNAAELG